MRKALLLFMAFIAAFTLIGTAPANAQTGGGINCNPSVANQSRNSTLYFNGKTVCNVSINIRAASYLYNQTSGREESRGTPWSCMCPSAYSPGSFGPADVGSVHRLVYDWVGDISMYPNARWAVNGTECVGSGTPYIFCHYSRQIMHTATNLAEIEVPELPVVAIIGL